MDNVRHGLLRKLSRKTDTKTSTKRKARQSIRESIIGRHSRLPPSSSSSSSFPSLEAEPSPFLRLPREIRDQIYTEVLTYKQHSEIWIRWSFDEHRFTDATWECRCYWRTWQMSPRRRAADTLGVGILGTCRQIHDEAATVLYGWNQVWVDGPPGHVLDFLSKSLQPSSRAAIRFLKLWMRPHVECNCPRDHQPKVRRWGRVHRASMYEQNIERVLLNPWRDLFAFLAAAESMPELRTVCVLMADTARDCLASGPMSPMVKAWSDLCFRGWMKELCEISTLQTLLVQLQGGSCYWGVGDGLHLESLNKIRKNLVEMAVGFEEESVRWTTYFPPTRDNFKDAFSMMLLLTLTPTSSSDKRSSLVPLPPYGPDFNPRDYRLLNVCPDGDRILRPRVIVGNQLIPV